MLVVGDKADSILIGLPPAFAELPHNVRQMLASRATLRQYRKNEKIVDFGQSVPPVLALRSGLAAIIHSPDLEKPAVDFIRAGGLYAESTAGDNVSASEVLALQSSVGVLFPVDAFEEAMLMHPPFARWYLHLVENQRNQQYLHRVKMRTLRDEAHFAYFLWWLSDPLDDDRRILRTKLPERVIALYLGVAREQVNRKKQLLEKTGHILSTDEGLELMPSLATLFSLEAAMPMPGERPFHAAYNGA